jgi:hypothetical protein
LLLAGVACHGTPTPAPEAPYKLVDLTDNFLEFYQRAQALPPQERIGVFTDAVGRYLPDFYAADRFGSPPNAYPDALSRALDSFPGIQQRFALLPATFRTILPPALRTFRQAFPDLPALGPVYLLHSLGTLDGGTRPIAGVPRLLFGIDVIAQTHRSPVERPFLHHELFHLYHSRFFSNCTGMWCSLWREGLAVYVASALNPGATDDDLGLARPQPLRPYVEAHLAAVLCAVQGRLDSTNNAPYFSVGRTLGDFPPRFGYFVGYLVARQAAKKHRLQDLAHLPPAKARPVLEAALTALGTCHS